MAKLSTKVHDAPKKDFKIREHSLHFMSVQKDPVTELVSSKILVDLDSHGKQSPRKMNASKLRSSPSLS
jgi:hypothetical protein